MATGNLKMWNGERGFGFISDDSGGPFLHVTALEAAGIDEAKIKISDRIVFDVGIARDGRTTAGNVRLD